MKQSDGDVRRLAKGSLLRSHSGQSQTKLPAPLGGCSLPPQTFLEVTRDEPLGTSAGEARAAAKETTFISITKPTAAP